MATKELNIALNDLERRRRWADLLQAGKKVGSKMGITSEDQIYRILNN